MEALTSSRGRSKGLGGKLLLMHLIHGSLKTSKLTIYAAKFNLLQVRPAPAWLQKLELHARLKLLTYVFQDKSVFLMMDAMVWGKTVPVDDVQKYSALFIGFIGQMQVLVIATGFRYKDM